jgi:acetyl-CoA carboxylase biotin carboxylase subunit
MKKVLIANRGEIACRIIKTCKKLGIETVAVFSDADRKALHATLADEAVHIGPSEVNASYLQMDKLIEVAKNTGADAIHPGYGFLSENATFAKKVAEAGIVFIGPNPDAIEKMGSKALSKAIAQEHNVPTIPGYKGKDQSEETLLKEAMKIGFPLLIKASAGGGGKGMRIVHEEKELKTAIQSAKGEALNAFGDDEVLLEKYLPSSRHIEIQIFGDKQGNAVYLLERECTIQRRYQKIFEESPSPVLSEATRKEMGEAAVRMAKALKYDNAGTVEFIYENGNFYFLEVNTRLQVEHPVTEAITGLDLVEWQIMAAEGKALPLQQSDIKANGYALQCRLYAEDAANDFMPVTGTVLKWETPEVEGARYDTGIRSGSEISVFYDPMISKVIVHGPDRATTLRRMRYALKNTVCLGTVTNLPFLQHILDKPAFEQGDYDTHYIANHITLSDVGQKSQTDHHLALMATTMQKILAYLHQKPILKELPFGWRNNFYQPEKYAYTIGETGVEVLVSEKAGSYVFNIEDAEYQLSAEAENTYLINGVRHHFVLAEKDETYFVHHRNFSQIIVKTQDRFPATSSGEEKSNYISAMPASVIKVLIKPGDKVENGQSLVVLSSMKMENTIAASEDGTIEEIYVAEGENIEAGVTLLKFAP